MTAPPAVARCYGQWRTPDDVRAAFGHPADFPADADLRLAWCMPDGEAAALYPPLPPETVFPYVLFERAGRLWQVSPTPAGPPPYPWQPWEMSDGTLRKVFGPFLLTDPFAKALGLALGWQRRDDYTFPGVD